MEHCGDTLQKVDYHFEPVCLTNYIIKYTVKSKTQGNYEGVAFVQATTADEALTVFKSNTSFNGALNLVVNYTKEVIPSAAPQMTYEFYLKQ